MCEKRNTNTIPVMADLQLPKKLILEPLVKVHVVKQLVSCQSHCIVYCGQNNHNSQKIIIIWSQKHWECQTSKSAVNKNNMSSRSLVTAPFKKKIMVLKWTRKHFDFIIIIITLLQVVTLQVIVVFSHFRILWLESLLTLGTFKRKLLNFCPYRGFRVKCF